MSHHFCLVSRIMTKNPDPLLTTPVTVHKMNVNQSQDFKPLGSLASSPSVCSGAFFEHSGRRSPSLARRGSHPAGGRFGVRHCCCRANSPKVEANPGNPPENTYLYGWAALFRGRIRLAEKRRCGIGGRTWMNLTGPPTRVAGPYGNLRQMPTSAGT